MRSGMVLAQSLAPQRMPSAARTAPPRCALSAPGRSTKLPESTEPARRVLTQELTARNGPPPGLGDQVAVLGGARLWTLPAGQDALRAAGASVLVCPRALLRFASWCSITPG